MHRRKPFYVPPGARGIGWVPTALRAVLKIRYLLLGGALGGGASLAKVRKILAKLSSKTSWNLVLCHSMKLHKKQSGKTQCGTYGNSLSRIFTKIFVKITVLLNKLSY